MMQTKRSKKFIFTLAALFMAISVHAQSEAVQNLKDKNYNCVTSYFLYESMIRAASNVMLDSSMSEMTEGARLLVVCRADKTHEDYRPELISPVDEDVMESGFEEMMSLKDGETRAKVYRQEIGEDQSRILMVMDSPEEWMAVELTGEIDLGKLMSLGPMLMKQMKNFKSPF